MGAASDLDQEGSICHRGDGGEGGGDVDEDLVAVVV